ncbi:MAG TPA: DUF72 domain-containing protein [Longimicrobiaceae bacterium]|nr:DUF72 domain-containing protein [Longimicrobiaceae bacterium]
MIRFGPAGWSYRDWAGIVYPQPRPRGFDPLEYLAGYFDTVEVNSTFYRPARASAARSWLERTRSNPDFRFTAKLWQRFTHQRKETWTAAEVSEARAALDPLLEEGRFGALLLQFPWSFRRTDENREWLGDVVGTFSDFPLVLEVRHASWNEPEFFRELADRGVGFVNIDQPLFHDSIAPSARATSQVGYIRVHGRNYREWWRKDRPPEARYDYLYSAEELEPWAERAKEIAEEPGTREVFVVTNNHYRGKGIANALMLRSMAQGKKVPAPPELFGEYGEVLEKYARPAEPERGEELP